MYVLVDEMVPMEVLRSLSSESQILGSRCWLWNEVHPEQDLPSPSDVQSDPRPTLQALSVASSLVLVTVLGPRPVFTQGA